MPDSTFGEIVRRIRGRRSQEALAAELSVSRSLIASAETNGRIGDSLVKALVNAYPDHASELNRAFAVIEAEKAASRADRKTLDEIERIDRLIASRRLPEALNAIRALLRDTRDQPPDRMIQLVIRLGHLLVDTGDPEAALQVWPDHRGLLEAPEHAAESGRFVDGIGSRLLHGHNSSLALALTDLGLEAHARQPAMWRRRGIIHWYGMHFADGYAALTLARALGETQPRIHHARGQLLADWGHPLEATAELERALDAPRTQMSRAYALCALAYAKAQLGEVDSAMRLFKEAKLVTPSSGWLFFRLARSYRIMGEHESERTMLEQAIEADAPRISEAMLCWATERLDRTGW